MATPQDNPPSPQPDMDSEADPEADAALMAQMGFTLFGSQKPKSQGSKQVSKRSPSSHSPSESSHPRQRQKHNPPSRTYASGANNTPLSVRKSTKPTNPQLDTSAETRGVKVVDDGDQDQDPRYEDSPVDVDSRTVEESVGGGNGVERRFPPPVQRLENGDCAFFRMSFVEEDPWRGMVGVALPEGR